MALFGTVSGCRGRRRRAALIPPGQGQLLGRFRQEVEWLPHVTQILRDQLKEIDFRVSSDFSPAVAKALQRGEIDLGFSRVEPQPDVTCAVIASEPIVATRSSSLAKSSY